jgi:POT family proton-dependent oligopeptide transporter
MSDEPLDQTISDQIPIQQPISPELEKIRNFKGKYPPQLWWLFLAEMWERFSFYGMRGMLTIFMVDKLLLSEKEANLQYGATQAFVYTFAFIGGMFADKVLGFRKSIFWGGLLMIAGSFILAFSPKDLFYIGISFTIIGTGFFKPNISTMVGDLYHPGDPRRDAGFGLFYSGINIGALLGGGLCIAVSTYSWNLAFSLAGIFMVLGLIVFTFSQRTLGPIGSSPVIAKGSESKSRLYRYFVYAGSLIAIPMILVLVSNSQYTDLFMYIVGPLAFFYLLYEMMKYSYDERKKLLAAFVFIFFSVFFWAFFEQSGGSLNLFAKENLNHDLLGMSINPNVVNNSANSFFVILFSPLIGLLFLWMNRKRIEPNSVVKFGIGFLFLALAFYVFYATNFFSADGIAPLWLFTLAYLVITLGELFLSPIGLSLMTKLSPKPLHGAMMGMWFLASAYGQYAAGILGSEMSLEKDASLPEKLTAYTDGYYNLAIYAVIAGVVLILISPLIRKLMGSVK